MLFRKVTLTGLLLAFVASLALDAAAMAANNWHRASARLFGPTGMKGKVRYEERPKSGTTFERFKVWIERGGAFQTYEVLVNGELVGTVTTNAGGVGRFELRTAQFIDDEGDGDPIPADFPRLDTGDTVTVGPISGTIFDNLNRRQQRYRIDGKVEMAGGVEYHAKYRERFKRGTLERRFDVEAEGVPAGNYPVLVNGEFVGTVEVGQDLDGDLELRTAAFIDDGDELPMPNSFPALKDGDTVQVGDVTIIMGQNQGDDDDDGDDNGGSGGGGGDDD